MPPPNEACKVTLAGLQDGALCVGFDDVERVDGELCAMSAASAATAPSRTAVNIVWGGALRTGVIAPGDYLTSVNGRDVSALESAEVMAILAASRPEGPVALGFAPRARSPPAPEVVEVSLGPASARARAKETKQQRRAGLG